MKLFQTLITIFSLATHLAVASETWKVESFGSFEIDLNIPEMGGLSALAITRFGKNFITLSDRGKYFQGTIDRNSSGLISNLNVLKSGSLLNSSGKALTGRNTDSESMTATQKKGFYISFESNDRIMFHKSLNAPGEFLPKHSDFELFGSKVLDSGAKLTCSSITNSDAAKYTLAAVNSTTSNQIGNYRVSPKDRLINACHEFQVEVGEH